MFCRYCGAAIAEDSLFCAKCGKKLGSRTNPRVEKWVGLLRLRTPYPYSALLILLAVGWMLTPSNEPVIDFTPLKWSFDLDRKLDLPEERLFQQGFSLVLENTGPTAVQDVPVELTARIEPEQPADVSANFLGRRVALMHAGKALPLVMELADEVKPGAKRRYSVEGRIEAAPPFKVTYEIRKEGEPEALARYVVER